jgi:hypothetical protein
MADLSLLDIHRRIMATPGDEDVCWWYFGTAFAQIEGHSDIATLHAETIMIYRPETLSATSYRLHWREIGYFRDPVTGEMAVEWLNPLTGETVPAPASFEEGPSFYTITQTQQGLDIHLVQAHATVRGINVTLADAGGGRANLVQQEHKVRGFPLADGTMPAPDSGAISQTSTELSFFADRAALELGTPDASCSGTYKFELSAVPPWMGFGARPGSAVVRGTIRKARMQDQLNESAWARLRLVFPGYFTGALLTPPW